LFKQDVNDSFSTFHKFLITDISIKFAYITNISSGNGSTEMRELNYTENHTEYYNSNQTQRPLQQIYHNKTDEDNNTVKQVI